MKIRPVGAELYQADGRDRHPDKTNLTVAIHNFDNAPNMHITVKRESLRVRWNFFENHILPSPALTAANFSTHFHSRNLKNRCSNKADKLHLLFSLRVCTFVSILLSFAHGQVWSLQGDYPAEINIRSTRNQQWRKTIREKFQLEK